MSECAAAICACPVCGGSGIRSAWPVKSNVDGALTHDYWVHRCGRCGVGIVSPAPSSEALSEHYESGVYQASGGRAFLVFDALLMAMCDQWLREIGRVRPPPGKLLDVGCGKGRFVARAATRGWDAQGVEPVPTQVAAARARYGIEVLEGDFQKAGFEDNSFDVVTAWHVLEHVAEPHELITEVHRIMRPGGLFACEVPNFDSLQAWLGRDRWFHLDVPRHLLQYTPEAVDLLLGGHGLRVVSRRTFSLQSGPFGMLESMLNRIGLPPNWLYRWVRRSVCEGDIAMLGLNLIAASLVAGPAFVAEAVACLAAGAGGVLGVIAVSG